MYFCTCRFGFAEDALLTYYEGKCFQQVTMLQRKLRCMFTYTTLISRKYIIKHEYTTIMWIESLLFAPSFPQIFNCHWSPKNNVPRLCTCFVFSLAGLITLTRERRSERAWGKSERRKQVNAHAILISEMSHTLWQRLWINSLALSYFSRLISRLWYLQSISI